MTSEQKPDRHRKKGPPAVFIVIGLTLLVIAMVNKGPLQWVLSATAIAMLFYSVMLTRKGKK